MSNFVDNNISLPSTKTNLTPIPAGASATNYVAANDYNSLAGAAQDIRTVIERQVSIMSFGADPTGSADNSTAFTAAFAALSGGGVLHLPGVSSTVLGVYKITNNVTVPAGVILAFENSKVFLNATAQLIINGGIQANSLQNIFTWDGSNTAPVVWTNTGAGARSTPSVMWFGAVGNGSTDDTAAIQMALTVLTASTLISGTSEGAKLTFPLGSYKITSTLQILNAQYLKLEGEGEGTRIFWNGPAGDSMLLFINCDSPSVRSMALYGNTTNPPLACIESQRDSTKTQTHDTTNNHFEDLFLGVYGGSSGCTYGIAYTKAAGSTDTNNDLGFIRDVRVINAATAAFYISHSQSMGHLILHCTVYGPTEYGVLCAEGQFNVQGGYWGQCSISAFAVDATTAGTFISQLASEGCSRLLSLGAGGNTAPQLVTLAGVRMGCNSLNADGFAVYALAPGPITLIGCEFDGATSPLFPQIYLNAAASAGSRLTLIGNSVFCTSSVNQSLVAAQTYLSSSVVDIGTSYVDGSNGIAFRNDPSYTGGGVYNSIGLQGSSTGNPGEVVVAGLDTNIGVNIVPKGTGALTLSKETVTNYCLQSAAGTVSPWTHSADASLSTSGIAAPDGTLTATEIATSVAASFQEQVLTAAVTGQYTFSIWARTVTSTTTDTQISVYDTTNSGADASWVGGLTTTWTRISATTPSASPVQTGDNLELVIYPSGGSVKDIIVWGAQLEADNFVGAYVPTTTVAVTETVANFAVTAAGHILPSSTNLSPTIGSFAGNGSTTGFGGVVTLPTTGSDAAGIAAFTTGSTTGTISANTALFTITLSTSYASTQFVAFCTNQTAAAPLEIVGQYYCIPGGSGANFTVYSTAAITPGTTTTYSFQFITMGAGAAS